MRPSGRRAGVQDRGAHPPVWQGCGFIGLCTNAMGLGIWGCWAFMPTFIAVIVVGVTVIVAGHQWRHPRVAERSEIPVGGGCTGYGCLCGAAGGVP